MILAMMMPVVSPSVVNTSGVKSEVQAKVNKSKLTVKNYKKCKKGMTYKKVCRILGCKGEKFSESDGYKQFSWDRHYGGKYLTIEMGFDHGKLDYKMYMYI